jgi:hypothetical protein
MLRQVGGVFTLRRFSRTAQFWQGASEDQIEKEQVDKDVLN